MEKAKDLLTGEDFIKKRINQRFASAENRVRYYNRQANYIRHSLSYINKPLYNNFKVLCGVMGAKSEGNYNKFFLEGRGLHFGVFTHYKNYEGVTHKAIYDFIIIPTGNDNIKIIKMEQND